MIYIIFLSRLHIGSNLHPRADSSKFVAVPRKLGQHGRQPLSNRGGNRATVGHKLERVVLRVDDANTCGELARQLASNGERERSLATPSGVPRGKRRVVGEDTL